MRLADTSAILWVIYIDAPVLVLGTDLRTAKASAVFLAPEKALGALLRFANALALVDTINQFESEKGVIFGHESCLVCA